MDFLDPIDTTNPELGDLFDELPLWSAPFGLLLLERVPMRAGLTIVDIGAGTGFLSVELAQRCGPSTRVIAVDPWPVALRRLQRKLDALGLSNVALLEHDAAKLELPEASVDMVVSSLGINNFDDPAAVLRACFRVLKPGGMLLLTSNLTGHMAEFYEVYRATLIQQGHPDRLELLDAHIAHRGTVQSISILLRDAGFQVAETITDTFRMRFADGTSLLRHWFIRLGFVPAWRAIAPPDALHPTFEALERNLNAVTKDRGELALTIPMTCIAASKPEVRA